MKTEIAKALPAFPCAAQLAPGHRAADAGRPQRRQLAGGGDWFGHYVEQQMPFAGIGNMEYVDHQFVAAQLQAQQRIGSNNYVLLRVAAAQQSDRLRTLFDSRTLLGGQIAYYYNTIVGPVGATVGYSNRTKKPYFFLNLGYEF